MTNTHDIQDALKRLEDLGPKTTAAKLRALFPVIEAKIAAGIRHADILDSLHAAGIDVSMATYKGTLQRLRKEAQQTAAPGTPAPTFGAAVATPAAAPAPPTAAPASAPRAGKTEQPAGPIGAPVKAPKFQPVGPDSP
ncbi:hypothetical protein QYG33_21795, partial [Xanthomonas euvesicatoria]